MSKTYTYKGIYAHHIYDFIEYKKGLGYKFVHAHQLLKHFDELTIVREEKEIGITKELFEEWRDMNTTESHNSKYKRVNFIRIFSQYLFAVGFKSFIPRNLKNYNHHCYNKYIYNNNEIEKIFKIVDELARRSSCKSVKYKVPVILRLTYGCGLRIGETLGLKKKDIDFENRLIIINDTKTKQMRVLPVSDDLVELIIKFINDVNPNIETDEYIFNNNQNNKVTTESVYHVFRDILKIANIPHTGKGPRVHDFRATFAVHALNNMVNSGMDIYTALPILSNYLGHKSYYSTEHYILLTEQHFNQILSKSKSVADYLYEEATK